MTCYLTEGKVQEIVNLHYLKENLFNGTYSIFTLRVWFAAFHQHRKQFWAKCFFKLFSYKS